MVAITSFLRVKEEYQGVASVIFIVILILILIFLVGLGYYQVRRYGGGLSYSGKYDSYFVDKPHYGKDETELKYKSFHEGTKKQYNYTLSGFIYVKDWKYRYYLIKQILSRGDHLPSIYLDKRQNNLIVEMGQNQSISKFMISNIDIKKWFHFALVLKDVQVELYYNGKVYDSYLLSQLPKFTEEDFIVCAGNGFDGLLYDWRLYPVALNHKEIYTISRNSPPLNEKYFKDK